MSKSEIIELIDELSERLEGPAEQLYALAVRSTLSSAIIALVASVLTLVGFAWLARRAVRTFQEEGGDVIDHPGYFIGLGLGGIAAIVAFVYLFTSVHQIINVEFYAIKSLVPGL